MMKDSRGQGETAPAVAAQYERLETPREHLQLLIEPAARLLWAALEADEGPWLRAEVLDRSIAAWRGELREGLGLSGPVVAAGHQAEFFHAGVFAKNIAVHELARRAGGTPVFVTVDSDLPKSAVLPVPEVTADGLRLVRVPLPGLELRWPEECQPPGARQRWVEFFEEVGRTYGALAGQSLLGTFAAGWRAGGPEAGAADGTPLIFVNAMARGRRAAEVALGLAGIRELRVSQLAQTPAFRAFATNLFLNAARLAHDYNSALAAFRGRRRVKHANRPVPALLVEGERVETPFWVYRCRGPRARLFVHGRGTGGGVRFFADGEEVGSCEVRRLRAEATGGAAFEFEEAGWQLRPRALVLSAFARLFLADLFLHGIGGARYDEITDDYLARFFGVQPPPLACLSATAYLPLPHGSVRPEEVRRARREVRDVHYNPQRYLAGLPGELLRRRERLIRETERLRAGERKNRAARRAVWAAIREVNGELLARHPEGGRQTERLHAVLERLERQRELDQIACDREYFFALHPRATLEALVERVRRGLAE